MLTFRKGPAAVPEPNFDRRGYYRSPVTLSDYRKGQPAPNKGKRYPPEPLTRQEVYALMRAMGRGAAGRRDRALVVVLWRAALRISEALALYPKDIDRRAGTITVLHGKGDKRRVVGLDPDAMALLLDWLEWRYRLGLTRQHAVFCVITRGRSFGAPMHSSVFREKLKHAAAQAGIDKRVAPHQLRHTCASEMAREKIDVLSIQDHLGHTSPATTFRYIHRLNPWHSIEVAQARSWDDGADAGPVGPWWEGRKPYRGARRSPSPRPSPPQ